MYALAGCERVQENCQFLVLSYGEKSMSHEQRKAINSLKKALKTTWMYRSLVWMIEHPTYAAAAYIGFAFCYLIVYQVARWWVQ